MWGNESKRFTSKVHDNQSLPSSNPNQPTETNHDATTVPSLGSASSNNLSRESGSSAMNSKSMVYKFDPLKSKIFTTNFNNSAALKVESSTFGLSERMGQDSRWLGLSEPKSLEKLVMSEITWYDEHSSVNISKSNNSRNSTSNNRLTDSAKSMKLSSNKSAGNGPVLSDKNLKKIKLDSQGMPVAGGYVEQSSVNVTSSNIPRNSASVSRFKDTNQNSSRSGRKQKKIVKLDRNEKPMNRGTISSFRSQLNQQSIDVTKFGK